MTKVDPSKHKGKPVSKPTGFYTNLKLQILIVSLFAFVLYAKIISYDFIGLDEPTLIFDNYKFIHDASNIPQAFKQHVFEAPRHTDNPKDYYRPVLTLSFMLDAQLTGSPAQFAKDPQAKFFHLFNILYHITSCVLLLVFLRKLNVVPPIAFGLALIFAAHPLLTQAVAWIPGRNDSLITIFILLSFIYLINYLNNSSIQNLVLHLLFFMIALFTKESAVALVPLSIFYILSTGKFRDQIKPLSIVTVCYLSVVALWFIMRQQALLGSKVDLSFGAVTAALTQNSPLFLQYIQKSILPFNLSVMSSVKDTNYILGIIAVLFLVIGIYFSESKNRKMIVFGLAWFFLFLTPSLLAQFFEGLEHRAYLPMVGLFICVSCFNFSSFFKNERTQYLTAGIILLFMIISFIRLPIFSNRLAYWESAIQASDNSSLACLNLGKTYETMGKYKEAITAYQEGLKRNPNERLLHNNIGGALIYMQRYGEAEVEIKKEIELHPDNSYAYYNLGLIKKITGKTEEAIPLFEKSLEKNKNFIYAYQQLADYYKSKNDTAKFTRYMQEIKRIGY